MAQKTVKKAVTKPAAKKAVVKKAAVKKPVAKKTVKIDVEPMVAPEMHQCAHECQCHAKCGGGCRFGRFVRKLLLALIIFALGFAAANVFCGNGPRSMRGPRVDFVNGCVDMASVKCPQLTQMLANADANSDGCISREEYRAAKREFRRAMRAARN